MRPELAATLTADGPGAHAQRAPAVGWAIVTATLEGKTFPLRTLILLPLSVFCYAALLHWAYSTLISPSFSYLGYRYAPSPIEDHAIQTALAVVAALGLPRRLDRASSFVLWLLYVVTVAPAILMAPYTSYLSPGGALLLGLVLSVVFLLVSIGVKGEARPLRLAVSPTSLWMILAAFSATTYLLLAFTQGLSLRLLSFFDVYDVRAEYSDNAEGIGLLVYLVFNQANVINPLVVARGIFTRRPLWVAAGILGQLVLYSGTGFKGMIFAIPAWIIVSLLLRRRASRSGEALVWGASALVLVSALVDYAANSIFVSALIVRRFILTPGVFTSVYVEFFSSNPQVHLGHSVFRLFVDYPYERTPPFVIGEWMAGLPTMAANANMFADGYANFGYLGVVVGGFILMVYLRVLDRAAAGLPAPVVAVVMTMPTLALSNSSILTSMLSHGLLAAIVVLAVTPRDFSAWNNASAVDPTPVSQRRTTSRRRSPAARLRRPS